jgi:hypothetical protein
MPFRLGSLAPWARPTAWSTIGPAESRRSAPCHVAAHPAPPYHRVDRPRTPTTAATAASSSATAPARSTWWSTGWAIASSPTTRTWPPCSAPSARTCSRARRRPARRVRLPAPDLRAEAVRPTWRPLASDRVASRHGAKSAPIDARRCATPRVDASSPRIGRRRSGSMGPRRGDRGLANASILRRPPAPRRVRRRRAPRGPPGPCDAPPPACSVGDRRAR